MRTAACQDNWFNHCPWSWLYHSGSTPAFLYWWLRHKFSVSLNCFWFWVNLVFNAQLWQRQIYGSAHCHLCLCYAINLKQYILCSQSILFTWFFSLLHYPLTELRMFSPYFTSLSFHVLLHTCAFPRWIKFRALDGPISVETESLLMHFFFGCLSLVP